jgi:topoisomerase IA-like protein
MVTRDTSVYQQAGRIGGLVKNAKCPDLRAATQAARDARFATFLNQVPMEVTVPKGSTLEAERTRRAEMLLKAHMQKLAMCAASARTRAAAERRRATEAEAELEDLEDAG